MDHKTTAWNSQALTITYEMSSQFMGYAWAIQQIRQTTQDTFPVWLDLMLLNPKTTDLLRERFVYTQEHLSEWKEDVLTTADQIIACDTHEYWPKHGAEACRAYNRPCQFVELCRNYGPRRERVSSQLFTTGPGWDPANREREASK